MRFGSTLLSDALLCLRFATRLPVPGIEDQSFATFPRAIRMLPLAGAMVGALAGGVLGLASFIGFPPQIAAPLAIAVLILSTGALHEDGLADCADGFGGGATCERKLEIMKDSRIGAFGALALALTLYLRAASIASILDQSLGLACAVLIGAAAVSRAAALIPLVWLPPARKEGAGFSAGRPAPGAAIAAACLGTLFALAPALAGASSPRLLIGIGAAAGAGFGASLLAKRQIGGQTGDVAGAAQQISEVLFYLVFAANRLA
ncbi:adenosylcobinamide-GDP ribazoletransferase [Methylocapsa palsarum]|uniref:Adenosylcobinamide-GDP ribazoletransferase n=1 Tax=Methylocapsa palsarum TaxID=1612308 RepID=A0A1I3XX57_9HYPH|nr:adenosylcobinamide-GDP ribazoletransferase [Methylocapsa palsarum]SFK24237.1 adenosylcobinamide-GDP ribazoletransferase [Methylocapsa palsarum]